MKNQNRAGFYFKTYEAPFQSPFDRLFPIFKELITHTSGDFDEAIAWLRELDKEYKLTDASYTIDDFIEDLKKKGYIREELKDDGTTGTGITAKTERAIRQQALDTIFGTMKRSGNGNHKTKHSGNGDEHTGEFREFHFGDSLERISLTESLRNAQINNGVADFKLTENDLVVEDTQYKAQMSTVLMIDISHSMILYGEDRITPAKKVAMALAELITTRYPKDTLDILVFGNDAWTIAIKDLPYLKVGPYHTNTVAGLMTGAEKLAINETLPDAINDEKTAREAAVNGLKAKDTELQGNIDSLETALNQDITELRTTLLKVNDKVGLTEGNEMPDLSSTNYLVDSPSAISAAVTLDE